MLDPAKEQEYREEAERLAALPAEDQRAVVEMYRGLAANPRATMACRAEAERKAAALARFLGLESHRKPAKPAGKPDKGKASAKGRKR